jgi:hypothetical protein
LKQRVPPISVWHEGKGISVLRVWKWLKGKGEKLGKQGEEFGAR